MCARYRKIVRKIVFGRPVVEKKGVQGLIGYRRHTHRTQSYGKCRFRCAPCFDAYICPEQRHLYWKTATREGNANTRAIAKPIRDGQRALVRVWREGWWRDMPGRMLWTTSLP